MTETRELTAREKDFSNFQYYMNDQMRIFTQALAAFENEESRGLFARPSDCAYQILRIARLLSAYSEACLANEAISKGIFENDAHLAVVMMAKSLVETALAHWPTPAEAGPLPA